MRGGGGRGVRRVEVRTRFEKKFVDRLDAVVINSGREWQQTLVKGTRLSISARKKIPVAHQRVASPQVTVAIGLGLAVLTRPSAALKLEAAVHGSGSRLSARRSRRQSSQFIFCITIIYAWTALYYV
jgi:hypothetical protein